MVQDTIEIPGQEQQIKVFGPQERHLKKIRETFAVSLTARRGIVKLAGDEAGVKGAKESLAALRQMAEKSPVEIRDEDVDRVLGQVQSDAPPPEPTPITLLDKGRTVVPKTAGQLHLVRMIRTHDIVFCSGPAGTGKTYMAMAMALHAMGKNEVRKIVLARPAVEAGEKLGFLPGDLYEKVNPYLRPLYDAMEDLLDLGKAKKLLERGLVEIVPVAFMRGRTLDRAFVILDEAQNCTTKQMMMFLTRLGVNAKAVITGDPSQVDLPPAERSGLVDAWETLRDVPGIGFVDLRATDVLRHPLVKEIVNAYERRKKTDQ